ncbi:MAG: outer membrane lipoprotein-sorting protein [Bacteroidota bacterium]
MSTMNRMLAPLALSFVLFAPSANALSAQEMLKKATETLYPGSYQMSCEMRLMRPEKKDQVYRMTVYKKGEDKSLAEFSYPASERERKLLRVKDNLWMYMPSIKRAIRIAPRDRLFGGEVSNNDLTRVDYNLDYTATLVGKENYKGTKAVRLNLKAVNNTVPYDRVEWVLEANSYLPLHMDLFTQSGKLLKTIDYEEPKLFDGMRRPSLMVMKNTLQDGYVTSVTVSDLEAKSFPDSMFTQAALSK